MCMSKWIPALSIVMAVLLLTNAVLPTRPAIAAQAESGDAIAYDVRDQQRALLDTDLIALCRQQPVLCAETRLILATAQQLPNLNADAYYQLRDTITAAFRPDREREEAGRGAWFGAGELALTVTEQRGMEALNRLEGLGTNVAPLVPALVYAIAALTSSDEENIPGVPSSWGRSNAQQQEADLAQWRR